MRNPGGLMGQALGHSMRVQTGFLTAMVLIFSAAGTAVAQTRTDCEKCMEVVEDVGGTGGAGAGAAAESRPREPDERVSADSGLPVTVEDAFVPSPGETEAQLHFFYDHQRPSIDGDKEYGRHLYTPEAEVEIGIVNGFSATIGTNYSLGNAEDAKSGE